MQTKDLTTLTPQAAIDAMCAMENGEMDRIAARCQGWTQSGVKWIHNEEVKDFFITYSPSTDLNQAYELLEKVQGNRKLNRIWSYRNDSYEHRLHWIKFSDLDYGPDILVLESKAKSHARAVTILACVGLLFGGGK